MHADPQIFFHLGLPKTASTFLQRKVFPNLQDINFFKKRRFHQYKYINVKNASNNYLFSSEFDFELSNKLKEISGTHPDAGIILVFRKHGNWLESKYKYYIRKNGYKDLRQYFDFNKNQGVLKMDNLHYYEKIRLIEKYFYKPPLILFYEELKNNPVETIQLIAQWTNSRVNWSNISFKQVKPAYNERQLKILKKFNKKFVYQPSQSNNIIVKKAKKKSRELIVHSLAYASLLTPHKYTNKHAPLYDQAYLHKIDAYFQDDWNNCIQYANQHRQKVLGKHVKLAE